MPHPHHAEATVADHFDTVCHDLRQRIAAGLMLSNTDDDELPADDAPHRLEVVHQQLVQAAQLMDILTDPPEQPAAEADLVQCVRECVGVAKMKAPVLLSLPGEEVPVPVDDLLLRRAVTNLLENAIRATQDTADQDGAGVEVCVGTQGAESFVQVSDHGPGFGRISSQTGHGLEVVRAAVWAAGGRFQLDTGPHAGTTIRLIFPGKGPVAVPEVVR